MEEKVGVQEEGLEGEMHLIDKPHRHPGNDDSNRSYPTP